MGDQKAVFLDRDGVIIEDTDSIVTTGNVSIFDGVAESISRLNKKGYLVLVVSNQPNIARGLITESDVKRVNAFIKNDISSNGGIINSFYYCPHHPNATITRYRTLCECRKPRSGMLLKASEEYSVRLSSSYMVGDRPSDTDAGSRVGCKTILLNTGMQCKPPIVSPDPISPIGDEDFSCNTLKEAVDFILRDV